MLQELIRLQNYSNVDFNQFLVAKNDKGQTPFEYAKSFSSFWKITKIQQLLEKAGIATPAMGNK